MPLDPKKLRTYLASSEPQAGRRGMAPEEAKPLPASMKPYLKPGQKPDELLALLERGDETTPEQLGRLLSPKVSYMELDTEAKGFVCGACGYFAEGAMCRNPAVLAPVSEKHGCCNLYWSEDLVVFPPPAKD